MEKSADSNGKSIGYVDHWPKEIGKREQLGTAHVFSMRSPGWPETRQLPSGLIPMGEILATSGLISSGSVGDIQLSWHDAWRGACGERSGEATSGVAKWAGVPCDELVSLLFSWS